jgi:hypothetical protein
MTKIVKFYKRIKFWEFISYIVTPIAAVGEGLILTFDGHWLLHVLIFVAVALSAYAKAYVKDENKDGIVD